MKKILILGASGMLGHALSMYYKKNSYDVTGLSRNDFDAAKNDVIQLDKSIDSTEVVVNCIGIIKPMIEKNSDIDVIKVNGIFPHNLAKLCRAKSKKLIHITTDCAFSGNKGNYDENDIFDVDDMYGVSKISGESTECMTLRTSFVGPEEGNKRSLLEWAFTQKGKTVNGFINHRWNGLSTLYFAQTLEQIIKQNLYKEGIFHIYSPDTVTKFELVSIFNDVFDLSMTIHPVEASAKCDRSLTSIHDLSKKVCTKPLKEQIEELKSFFSL